MIISLKLGLACKLSESSLHFRYSLVYICPLADMAGSVSQCPYYRSGTRKAQIHDVHFFFPRMCVRVCGWVCVVVPG